MLVASGAQAQVRTCWEKPEGGPPCRRLREGHQLLFQLPHPWGTLAPALPGPPGPGTEGGRHTQSFVPNVSLWPFCHCFRDDTCLLMLPCEKSGGPLELSCKSHTRAFCHKDTPSVGRGFTPEPGPHCCPKSGSEAHRAEGHGGPQAPSSGGAHLGHLAASFAERPGDIKLQGSFQATAWELPGEARRCPLASLGSRGLGGTGV